MTAEEEKKAIMTEILKNLKKYDYAIDKVDGIPVNLKEAYTKKMRKDRPYVRGLMRGIVKNVDKLTQVKFIDNVPIITVGKYGRAR